ncbi:MAG TPA: putative toxin-antitoxin system toxin component, PIN family [Verrucomicrobiota bacterium]|nr:putative toxin-antitoxin system toxin component, PIN family [Verrucomicrobiota bacterium]
MKLVVDTNVLMSGSAWSGTASRLVDALLAGEATLCLSEALLAELADVFQRERFRKRLEERGQDPTAILSRLRRVAEMTEPKPMPVPASLRDSDDVHVLACAVAAPADAIVTGDDDLLALEKFEGIPIIEIGEALRRLGLRPG